MSDLKTITLHSHAGGPNPWKVALILEELGIPYFHKYVDFALIKKEPYININPNGRVPSIEDPNTGITLWESGAIIQYLIETYDKEHKLSYDTFPEKYHSIQWLHFQMSGQGPYFGQKAWFAHFHPEQIQSAKDRYSNEIKRVLGVLDRSLQGKEWLVGDRITYADIAFIPWFTGLSFLMNDVPDFKVEDFPNYKAWMDRMTSRPKIAKVLEEKQASMEKK